MPERQCHLLLLSPIQARTNTHCNTLPVAKTVNAARHVAACETQVPVHTTAAHQLHLCTLKCYYAHLCADDGLLHLLQLLVLLLHHLLLQLQQAPVVQLSCGLRLLCSTALLAACNKRLPATAAAAAARSQAGLVIMPEFSNVQCSRSKLHSCTIPCVHPCVQPIEPSVPHLMGRASTLHARSLLARDSTPAQAPFTPHIAALHVPTCRCSAGCV